MPHGLLFTVLALALRALAWLLVTTLIFLPLEAIHPVLRSGAGDRHWAANLGWFFLNSMVTLPAIALLSGGLAWLIGFVQPGGLVDAIAQLPLWARLVLAMVVGELGFYWGHRWSHEWPWLWRFHCIHHSPEHLFYLVNTRMHPVDMIFTRLCGLTLLIACGLASMRSADFGVILTLVLLTGSAWSYFIHANVAVRLGPFEKLIASPAFHHWHHTRSDQHGHNYAAMLPVFDLVFGTYRQPDEWPQAYGTEVDLPDDLPGQLAFPFTGP